MKRIFVSVSLLLLLVVAACGSTSPSSSHSSHGEASANIPYDAQFIDGMKVHHQGAVDMAKEAQTQAEHSEIKQLATTIISTQNQEIAQLTDWRKQWYPNIANSNGAGAHMGDMEISKDASQPFDLRFINAMISHHQGAVDMAKEAEQKAEHSEIKKLAQDIIKTQTAEIKQMQQWKSQWYPKQGNSNGQGGHGSH